MKNKKLISLFLGTVLVTNVLVSTVFATDNVSIDSLYKNAYNATQNALTVRTQGTVNVAREEIRKLPAKLHWAIGEFSKQVDTVQHPILVNIVNSIKQAEKSLKQADIDKARSTIPTELTQNWKNSYSSALDKVQQKLQVTALDLLKKAETEKTQASVDAALVAINEMRASSHKSISDWANILYGKANAIVVTPEKPVEPENPGNGGNEGGGETTPENPDNGNGGSTGGETTPENPDSGNGGSTGGETTPENPDSGNGGSTGGETTLEPGMEAPITKPNWNTVSQSQVVKIKDPIVEEEVRKTINKSTGDILFSDMLKITMINLAGKNVTSIHGLEYARNMVHIDLGGVYSANAGKVTYNNVTDISPLAEVPSLHTVILTGNAKLKDISYLARHTSMNKLFLSSTNVTDISVVKNYSTMDRLTLSGLSNIDFSNINGLQIKNLLVSLEPNQDDSSLYEAVKSNKALKYLDISSIDINNPNIDANSLKEKYSAIIPSDASITIR